MAGQAHVLADLSRAHRADGEPRTARLTHRRALHVATVAGLEPLVEQLRAATGDDGVAPGAEALTATLTESERRVAGLAVRGYSNREIGARLYVTPSTVEQHLTRVYRKLGVTRRRDLPPVLWVDVTQAG